MTCPNCGAIFDENCRFCGVCGTPLTPEKKGTHRVPLLIMLFLTVLGLCVYFITGADSSGAPVSPYGSDPCLSASGGTLRFDASQYTGDGQLTVPAVVDSQVVDWLADSCFRDCDVLTEVFLPDTVTHVGQFAFADCDQLIAMDLPPELNTIGAGAFTGCDTLEAVHVPGTVNFIGWDAFSNCPSLTYIFFDGTWDKWNAIYGQDLGTGVTICCSDGNYNQAE